MCLFGTFYLTMHTLNICMLNISEHKNATANIANLILQ